MNIAELPIVTHPWMPEDYCVMVSPEDGQPAPPKFENWIEMVAWAIEHPKKIRIVAGTRAAKIINDTLDQVCKALNDQPSR